VIIAGRAGAGCWVLGSDPVGLAPRE